MNFVPNKSDFYNKGWEGFFIQRELGDNPYSLGSEEHTQWSEGFNDALDNCSDLMTFLTGVRQKRQTFAEGLEDVKRMVSRQSGKIESTVEDGCTFYYVEVGKDKAVCFQPYPDIDRFYFEM